jgi:hypothetical protein
MFGNGASSSMRGLGLLLLSTASDSNGFPVDRELFVYVTVEINAFEKFRNTYT